MNARKPAAKLQLGFSPLSKTIRLAKCATTVRIIVDNDTGSDVTNEAAQLVWQVVISEGGEIGWRLNHVESLWQAPHDTITRNYQCRSMWQLLKKVHQFMETVSPLPGGKYGHAKV